MGTFYNDLSIGFQSKDFFSFILDSAKKRWNIENMDENESINTKENTFIQKRVVLSQKFVAT